MQGVKMKKKKIFKNKFYIFICLLSFNIYYIYYFPLKITKIKKISLFMIFNVIKISNLIIINLCFLM